VNSTFALNQTGCPNVLGFGEGLSRESVVTVPAAFTNGPIGVDTVPALATRLNIPATLLAVGGGGYARPNAFVSTVAAITPPGKIADAPGPAGAVNVTGMPALGSVPVNAGPMITLSVKPMTETQPHLAETELSQRPDNCTDTVWIVGVRSGW
jgi:hypothetical protein